MTTKAPHFFTTLSSNERPQNLADWSGGGVGSYNWVYSYIVTTSLSIYRGHFSLYNSRYGVSLVRANMTDVSSL